MRIPFYHLAGVEARYRDKIRVIGGRTCAARRSTERRRGLEWVRQEHTPERAGISHATDSRDGEVLRKTRPLGPSAVTRAQAIRDTGTSGPVLVPGIGSLECCLWGESQGNQSAHALQERVRESLELVGLSGFEARNANRSVGRRSAPGRACPRSGLRSGSDIARRTACLRR